MAYPFTESIQTNMEITDNTYPEAFDLEQEETIQWPRFERFYFFVMLIYAAQMTPDTARMIGNLSGNPIPFLIPILLTIVLLFRNPISFADKKLWTLLGITGLWSIASIIKYNAFSTEELSYHFFLYYAIIIAYIHIKVYNTDLMTLYEKAMVTMCKIAIPLWLLCVIVPSIATPFFDLFPATGFGHNFLYIFNKINANVYVEYPFLRNAGFSWEPGRFAIMICFAILFNIQRNGITFKGNTSIFWLLVALISTESTTGYSIVLALYGLHFINNLSVKNIFLVIILFIPIVIQIFQLDFMLGKINAQYEGLDSLDELVRNTGEYTDKKVALDRMPSIVIEFQNFIADPLLGYSRNFERSAIFSSFPKDLALTGGFMQMLSQYGLFIGIFFYALLFHSSHTIGRYYESNKTGLAVCTILSSISYPLFIIPIFTAFWLQGVFLDENDDELFEYDEYLKWG